MEGDEENAAGVEAGLQEQIAQLQATIAAAEQRAAAAEAARNQAEAQARTAQANATAARAAAAAVGVPVPVQAPVVFAIAPAQLIQGNALIDYSNKKGQTLFEAATKPFGQIFDGDSKNLAAFRDQILDQATTAGWNVPGANILMVPDANGTQRNFVTSDISFHFN